MVPSTARSVGFDAAALSRAASTRSRASRARILDAHAPSRAREISIARASARLAAAAADGHGMCGITSSRTRGRHDLRRRSRVQTRRPRRHPPPAARMPSPSPNLASLLLVAPAIGFVATPAWTRGPTPAVSPADVRMVDVERRTGDNVEQIKDTKRDKVMTFSYDMSMEANTGWSCAPTRKTCWLHGSRAVITMSIGARPFVQITRPLMEAYAAKVGAVLHVVDSLEHVALREHKARLTAAPLMLRFLKLPLLDATSEIGRAHV